MSDLRYPFGCAGPAAAVITPDVGQERNITSHCIQVKQTNGAAR
jgi:hypothetical protein